MQGSFLTRKHKGKKKLEEIMATGSVAIPSTKGPKRNKLPFLSVTETNG